jgi:beta-lactam-binding protein with PASTA domain
MSFSGSTPLLSPSEFTITATPPDSNSFGGYSVGSGEARATQISNHETTGFLFVSTTSGAQTDNCYVAIDIPADSEYYSLGAQFEPGFGLDGTHFFTLEFFLSAGTPQVLSQVNVIINNGGASYTTPVDLLSIPRFAHDGTLPLSVAAALSGTMLTVYARNGATGPWFACTPAFDLTPYVSAATLLTWAAAMRGYSGGVPTTATRASAMYWGPISDLTGPSCDINFNDVVLLLPFDGTNGSTAYPDLSNYANTVVQGTGASLTTSNPLFGTASLAVAGLNHLGSFATAVPYAAGSPLDIFADSSWSIECATYITVYGAQQSPIIDYGGVQTSGASSDVVVFAGLNNDGITGYVNVTDNSAFSSGVTLSATGPMTANTWHRIGIFNNAGVTTVYLDGVAGTSTTLWTPAHYTHSGATNVVIGSWAQLSNSSPPVQIDELRITAGIARQTSNYTPPINAFPTISCTATVPNVEGLFDAPARAAIIAANLVVGTVTIIAGSPPGQVALQSPIGGTIVPTGSMVNLTEYEGVLVPSVANTSLSVVAPAILSASGFIVGTVTYEASGTIIAGNVIRQSPAAGSFASSGSGINLVVSSGLPSLRVPDIFGLSRTDAINALLSLGLVVGAISSAPSMIVPPNTVQAQNPSAGTPVAAGTIVSFVMSTGIPAVGTEFDFEATVISQYANSPIILQLVNNLNQYIDQSANFANFYNFVWNVDTAVGFGLDVWGKIVGVSRLLQIPNTTDYVGFDNGTRSPPDWQSMGSNQPPGPPVGGAMYTGYNATTAYLLGDDAYRQLILAKAFANIAATTAPAINQILQNLYGPGTAWVLNTGPMAISYNLSFKPSAIQLAILEQSGVIPTPPGVSVTIVVPP